MLRQLYSIPAINWLRDVVATIIVGRIVKVSLLIVIMFAYSTYTGYLKRQEVSANFNLDSIHYIVSGKNCKFIFDGDSLDVIHRKSLTFAPSDMVECPPEDVDFLREVSNQHESKTRGIYVGDVYVTYIIAFVLFTLSTLITLGNGHTPNISRAISLATVIGSWLIVSALLFPMTYRDYSDGAIHEYNNKEYYVISAILSKDGEEFITTSKSFLSMNRDLKANFPKPLTAL